MNALRWVAFVAAGAGSWLILVGAIVAAVR